MGKGSAGTSRSWRSFWLLKKITSENKPRVWRKPIKLQIAARSVGQIRSTEADKSGGLRASLTSAGGFSVEKEPPPSKTSAAFKTIFFILYMKSVKMCV